MTNMTNDKAYEILSNGLVNAPSEHEWCVAFVMAMDSLKESEQQVGYWIEHDHGLGVVYHQCSICKGYEIEKGRFCKWCGNKIIDEEE